MDIKMQNAIVGRTIQLTQYEIAVLVALSWTVDNHDSSPPSPSIKWIANKMAISIGSVKKAIESLHAKKVVKRISKRRTDSGQICNEYHVDIAKLRDDDVKVRNTDIPCNPSVKPQGFTRVHESSPRDNDTKKNTKKNTIESVYVGNDKGSNAIDLTCNVNASSTSKSAYSIDSKEKFMMWARQEDVASALMRIMSPHLPAEGEARRTKGRRIVELLCDHLVNRDIKQPDNPVAYVKKVLNDKIETFVQTIKQESQSEIESLLSNLKRLRRRLAEAQSEKIIYADNDYPEQCLNQCDKKILGLKENIASVKARLDELS